MKAAFALLGFVLAACATPLPSSSIPAQPSPNLTAKEIIARAHVASGGEIYTRPTSLKLTGYNLIHAPSGDILWDDYTMWRVFADEKSAAHSANGKVRIEAYSGGSPALLLTYDGVSTYNQNGIMDDQSANKMWRANFGFGAIRNALDDGWIQTRKPDRLIDGAPAYMVALTDPSGGETLFGIRQSDNATVYVGFDTPKGWHERYYSEFFTKPGTPWVQSGKVQLFYNGVMANQAFWTDFELNAAYDNSLFVVETD